jgi:hypothetical protein
MAENISTVNAEGAIVDNPKLEQVFSSIEKQLIAQTGFLKSMQSLQANQFKFSKDMAKKTESEKSRELVSQEDGSNLRDTKAGDGNVPKGKDSDLAGGISGLLASALSALGGATLGGILGGILSKSLPAILAPVIGSFVKGAVEEALKQFGADDKTAAVIGDAAKTGVTWGIWGRLLFGKWGGLVGLLAGVGSHLGKIMDLNQDNVIGGMMRGINDDPEFWNKWGAILAPAVAGVLYLLAKKLGIKLLAAAAAAVAAATAGAKVPPIVPGPGGVPGTTPGTVPGAPGTAPGAGPTAATTVKGGKAPTPGPTRIDPFIMDKIEYQKGGPTSTNQKMPSGMRTNSAGKVIDSKTGKFKSIADIEEALKKEGRTATLAKYSKFFKFAGPALSVIPALIDPAMAIYNDESEQEIKKQIAGALGTVGGAYLGAIAGAAGATMIPIVGQSGIGNLLGGIIGGVGGALSGEYLAETIAEALMGGPAPEPVSPDNINSNMGALPLGNSAPISQTSNSNRVDGRATMLNDPRLAAAPQITPASSMGSRADAMAGMQSVASRGTGAGVSVNNNMGGNVNNNTNVGGSSTTYNIFQSSGSNALSNSLPVPMAG